MTRGKSAVVVDILLVEDDPGDILLTREAWKELETECRLHVARNGEEALSFMRRQGGHRDAPRPDLVLMDLNLPRKDGRELLAEIKQDSALRRVPVIVLTTSASAEDIRRVYDLHANCYLVKPVNLDELFEMMRAIHDFWLRTARLPSGD